MLPVVVMRAPYRYNRDRESVTRVLEITLQACEFIEKAREVTRKKMIKQIQQIWDEEIRTQLITPINEQADEPPTDPPAGPVGGPPTGPTDEPSTWGPYGPRAARFPPIDVRVAYAVKYAESPDLFEPVLDCLQKVKARLLMQFDGDEV
uniref:Uncharacterized protein n=1 Tax=Cryptomonas curvata TaxID=233186 RepID=A0A7S0QA14_9CRYP